MRSQGGFVLLGLLLVLAILCHSGYSLQCYSCINPVPECATVTNCTPNFDACLHTIAGPRIYHRCWTFEDCRFDRISAILGEAELQYYCCKTDKCNHEQDRNHGTTLSGKTVFLLVTPFLAGAWNFYV
ncbi:CD59 glycoprotein-like [Lemur catta]|uniref:CD59 glycoprotein-like n=1 Tax=Lemur catta TaxID=9447 RepID=UPI001E26D273|nr:CD59 glycoprotein-like [Lemur catta]XP_045413722.1 CD59 glycoprotein-like [Lemur catta]XP_045413723.1 CD59 glycoprotein-like [Lemur catta]